LDIMGCSPKLSHTVDSAVIGVTGPLVFFALCFVSLLFSSLSLLSTSFFSFYNSEQKPTKKPFLTQLTFDL